jgi:hypothetical protein
MARGQTDLVLVGAVGALIVGVAMYEFGSHGRPKLSTGRASWTLTPGVVNPDVTPSTIHETICRRGWTDTIRPPSSYTEELVLRQMREYRRQGSRSDYQEDHLISLELGGDPTDPRNLWPEPRPRAERVDRIENELNDAICSGGMSLGDAQRRISEIKHTEG